MNDSELDELLARYAKDYNVPPANPPLDEIRERVHASRSARRSRPWIAGGILAAAAAMLAIGFQLTSDSGVSRPQPLQIAVDTNTVRSAIEDPRTQTANAALASAVESAQAALNENPEDTYYREHLEAMRENAKRFRAIQQHLSEAM